MRPSALPRAGQGVPGSTGTFERGDAVGNLVMRCAADEAGASALEYALVVALIALVIVAGLGLFGTSLNNLFHVIGGQVSNVMPSA